MNDGFGMPALSMPPRICGLPHSSFSARNGFSCAHSVGHSSMAATFTSPLAPAKNIAISCVFDRVSCVFATSFAGSQQISVFGRATSTFSPLSFTTNPCWDTLFLALGS
ncbi:hypothetical protein DIPPA_01116 [Diplonema papillatum]|nr:hypothetical protein DIPPA_01116 [Diplonema papillatum]